MREISIEQWSVVGREAEKELAQAGGREYFFNLPVEEHYIYKNDCEVEKKEAVELLEEEME